MAVVVVQLGQCGNQLGEALWVSLAAAQGRSSTGGAKQSASASSAPLSPFFDPTDGKARCILVDAEPKVVSTVCARNPNMFRPDNCVTAQSGRGNNWGAGYYGLCGARGSPGRDRQGGATPRGAHLAFRVEKDQREEDDTLLPRMLLAIHRETMRIADGDLEAIVVIHSLAGGTGSGLTSRLVEKLRKYFTHHTEDDELDAAYGGRDAWGSPGGGHAGGMSPAEREQRRRERDMEEDADGLGAAYGERRKAQYIVSVAVAPSVQGDTAVQGINVTLTLNSLLKSTDAVIVLRNDEAQAVGELNNFFVKTLLMPVLEYGCSFGAIARLVTTCAPNPQQKLLTLVPLPQRNYAKLRRSALLSRIYVTAADAAVRNRDASRQQGPAAMSKLPFSIPLDSLHTDDTRGILQWASSVRFVAPPHDNTADKGSSGSVLVLNQVEELNRSLMFRLLHDCQLKCEAGAYLHRFKDAGVSRDQILEAVQSVARSLCYLDDCIHGDEDTR